MIQLGLFLGAWVALGVAPIFGWAIGLPLGILGAIALVLGCWLKPAASLSRIAPHLIGATPIAVAMIGACESCGRLQPYDVLLGLPTEMTGLGIQGILVGAMLLFAKFPGLKWMADLPPCVAIGASAFFSVTMIRHEHACLSCLCLHLCMGVQLLMVIRRNYSPQSLLLHLLTVAVAALGINAWYHHNPERKIIEDVKGMADEFVVVPQSVLPMGLLLPIQLPLDEVSQETDPKPEPLPEPKAEEVDVLGSGARWGVKTAPTQINLVLDTGCTHCRTLVPLIRELAPAVEQGTVSVVLHMTYQESIDRAAATLVYAAALNGGGEAMLEALEIVEAEIIAQDGKATSKGLFKKLSEKQDGDAVIAVIKEQSETVTAMLQAAVDISDAKKITTTPAMWVNDEDLQQDLRKKDWERLTAEWRE